MQFAAQTSGQARWTNSKKSGWRNGYPCCSCACGSTAAFPLFCWSLPESRGIFSFLPIHQYRGALTIREMKSYSALLDSFYAERDLMDRMKQKSHDLLRLLANTSDRIARKIAAQEQELKECANRERLKISGDLIQANLYPDGKRTVRAACPQFLRRRFCRSSILFWIQP